MRTEESMSTDLYDPRYHLGYTLRSPGVLIKTYEEVPYTLYARYHLLDHITVTYLPKHSQTHRMGIVSDDRVTQQGRFWLLLLVGWIGAMGAGMGTMAARYASALRLLRYGMPAHGVVEWVQPPASIGHLVIALTDCTVRYRFNVPGGVQIRTCRIPGRVGKQLSADQNVTVLYDPDDLNRSYPYRAVRYTKLA